MTYEEDYYDDLVEEQDGFRGAIVGTSSFEDLKYSQNDEAFDNLSDMIFRKQKAVLRFQIENGVARFNLQRDGAGAKKIFLNKEIAQAVTEVLNVGKKTTKVGKWYAVDKDADENYMLHLIRKCQADGAIRYRQSTEEIVAVYPNGEINFGKLPYSLDELKEKLNTLG